MSSPRLDKSLRSPLAFLLTALALGIGCSARPATNAVGQVERRSIRHDGRDRSYVVRTPGSVSGAERVALVLVLHGGGGNADNAESMTGFTDKAREEGFIVVYPEGTSRRGPFLTWNAGHCCGYAMQQRIDDVGFVRALIDTLAAQFPVDRKRTFVTGMSNGAMMAHRLGIELSDKIAAIAPVVGAIFGDERRPSSGVSALMINGMLDQSVPYEGGPPGGRFSEAWDGTPARPALEQARFWAQANECPLALKSEDRGSYLRGFHDCKSPLAVEIYSVKDNGHAWPGGRKGSRLADAPGTALKATDVIWQFFAAHSKP